MSKIFKPGRNAVELDSPRPSRIRREPPGRVPDKTVRAYPTEREQWMVAIGVVLFALAFEIIIVAFSDYTN